MAELIDKKALLSLVNREKEMSSSEYSVGYVDAINDVNNMIDVLSTTTESEIRAMAIDEFAEKLSTDVESFVATVNGIEADLLTLDYFDEFIFEVAEQLKEE